ncbi:unnamed protein product [Closterium sp. NIES-53]
MRTTDPVRHVARPLTTVPRDNVSLFDHTSGASLAPPATADSATRSQWLTRDVAARIAIRNPLPLAECAQFGHHKTAKALYDAVVALYSSPTTDALGRLLLPYLFPEQSAFATVEDLVTHLCTSDACYGSTLPTEFLDKNPPPMYITLYFIVTRIPDSLRAVRDHFLAIDPTDLTTDLLEQHLLAAETSVVAVGAARGTPRTPFFEGCSPSPLAPSYASAAAVDVLGAEDVEAASASGKLCSRKGKGGRGGGGGSGGGGGGSIGGGGGSGGGGSGGSSGSGGTGSGGSRGGAVPRGEFGDEAERPRWAELLRSGVAIFDIDYDAILAAMYALSVSAEGDSYLCVPRDPGIEAAALGASDTTLTPLSAPVLDRLADPSGGPILARSSTVLPCPAVPSGSLSRLHLPSFSTNLVSTAVQPFTRTGRHLATFNRRPGSSLYTLATEPPQNLLWHHRLGHHSLPRLRGMQSCLLVCGLPRSLPPLPPSPAPPCLPCIEGRQRAAPHSLFPLTTAPLQTLHMDVWGPACVSGQGRERYFLLVVDDYTCYTTVFPLRSKGEVPDVLIPWIRAVRLQLRERFRQDLPVLRLHSDRGGEFSSDLLREFCRGEGILQSFTLPASPHQNRIAERRIGLVTEYSTHQLNLWPRVSLPETLPTLRWTGKVRDTSADKLSARNITCVFLGFPLDAPGWKIYHPTSRRAAPSQDVMFDESVPFYRLFPYRSAPLPPPPLFLAPGPPPVDPLPPQVPAPLGVSQVNPLPNTVPVEVAVNSGAARVAASVGAAFWGAASRGAEPADAEPEGAESEGSGSGGAERGGEEPWGAEPAGAEPGGAESEGAESEGAETRGTDSSRGPMGASPRISPQLEPLSPQQLREWFAQRTRLQSGAAGAEDSTAGGTGAAGAGGAAGVGAGGTGAGAAGGPGAAGPGVVGTGGTVAARAGGAAGVGAGDPGAGGAGGTRAAVLKGARTGVIRVAGAGGAAGVGAGDPGAGDTGAGGAGPWGAGVVGAGCGDTGKPRLYFAPPLQQVLGLPSSTGLTPPLLCPPPDQSQPPLQPASPLPAPSPYTEQTGGLTERREPASCPASPVRSVRTSRRVPCPRPPPFLVTHHMALRPSSVPHRVPLPSPPASSLADGLDPDLLTLLPPEFESDCPPSVGGECALGTDVLEDRQEEFECFVAAVPHLISMLIAPEGDPDAPNIPTPRSYVEAITGPYSSQWQTTTDAEMASWKSTGTYVDAVPPPGANIVDGMWIFRVKRPPGSPPALGFAPSTADPTLRFRRSTSSCPSALGLLVILATVHSSNYCILAHYVPPGRHRLEHWEATKRVLHYLCMGLVLRGRGPVVLTRHADASWVDDLATQRSSQGYTFSLGSGSISWRSTCSSSVLSSICEAEIYAGAMTAQELHWLTYLLTDLGERPCSSPVLYVDNKAMIASCQEQRPEHRTKHIALRYFLARELQRPGQLRLAYVATRANTADIFTKALQFGDHQRFCTVLGLVPTLPHLLTA